VDYCLPDMTGEVFIQKIKLGWPKVKFALLTGYADILPLNPDDWSQAPNACPLIAKNTRMEEILSGIEAAARGECQRREKGPQLTRVERLAFDRRAKPALGGIQRQLQAVYEKTVPETLMKPWARPLFKLLGRPREPVFSGSRR
jgi:hypothetical protein